MTKSEGRVPMDYAAWTALPVERRNALCAEAMGWHLSDPYWIRADGIPSGFNNEWWSPCTDRNDTDRMVNSVRSGYTRQFDRALIEHLPHVMVGPERRRYPMFCADVVLTTSPDLLAWAAWSALTRKEEM